jgi:phage internal scaffolding protein
MVKKVVERPVCVDAFGPFARDDLVFSAEDVGAKQSFKDECDINSIVRSFSETGDFVHLNTVVPFYGDVSGLEFRQMVDFINAAEGQFMSLPAKLRARFNNDPVQFVEFCEDPENLDEMRRLGLLKSEERIEAVVDEGASPAAKREMAHRQEGSPSVAVKEEVKK